MREPDDFCDPTPVQEREMRVRTLLQQLATYEHGKSGQHFYHSLTDADYAEVLSVMALYGDSPE